MKRRAFFKGAVAASAVASLSLRTRSAAAQMTSSAREYYEWRVYHQKAGADHALLDGFLENALIPALNRAGSKPIGVFTEIDPKDDPAVFVLIPHANLDAFGASAGKLNADESYLKAGDSYLQTAKSNPAFVRIESWLLRAFTGMPKMELPSFSKEKKTRIFEARTYESHSEAKALKKIEMFNKGEIDVMRSVGLNPVFYGEAVIGSNLPHLTYMLSAESREAHKEHFGGFGKDPRWKGLSTDPQYADTVSKISSRFLQPTTYSQV